MTVEDHIRPGFHQVIDLIDVTFPIRQYVEVNNHCINYASWIYIIEMIYTASRGSLVYITTRRCNVWDIVYTEEALHNHVSLPLTSSLIP